MNYLKYKKDYFGQPVNIYNNKGDLVYIGMKPSGTQSEMSEHRGIPTFKFYVNDEGASVEVPISSVFKLTSEDVINTEDMI